MEPAARTWWGNCAWDGLGIVAALGRATPTWRRRETLRVRDGRRDDALPRRRARPRWWADIGFT